MRQILSVLFVILSSTTWAQESARLLPEERIFSEAFHLFDQGKYGPAQAIFDKVAANEPMKTEVHKMATYYAALCAIELFHKDAEFLLTQFISLYPESPLVKMAWFHLGKFYFRDKKYKKAIEWLERVETELLTDEEQAEFYFKRGYSYFKIDNYDRALPDFAEVKKGESAFAGTATYYYAHIQYQNGGYESALENFMLLEKDPIFSPVVPFYISQIYYLQRKFDQLILYAIPVLDSTSSKRRPEIARLIGESYYNTNRYAEALPYLERYRDEGKGNRTRDDEYQLGFCYFKLGKHAEAIPCFEKASGNQDIIGQSAWYHLGWCQLQTNQKKFARNAWAEASKLNFDILIKEEALFDYAKLSYELGYDPYDEAVRALQDYINAYPESDRMDEAYTFLASIYATTKNYRVAIQSIDRIKKKTPAIQTAFQRVTYFRGIELLNDKQYDESIAHFEKSLTYPDNKELASMAKYWKGEAYYRKGDFANAVKSYQEFVFTPGSFNLKGFNKVNYHLGYAYLKQKDYPNAIIWFRKYVASPDYSDPRLAADAHVRTADCFFVTKNYTSAIEFYDKGITLAARDADYALFQKGLAQGVIEKFDQKIATMARIQTDFPSSPYADDAKYETARAYQILGREAEAYATYDGVLLNYPKSNLVAASTVQMGLIRYNQRKDDEAIALYKRVVEQYPGTEEARDAQLGIKRIYVDDGRATEYASFVNEAGLENISASELDSTAWEAAENSYLKGNCEKAITQLGGYLRDFPNGSFRLSALGFKSDCEVREKRIDEAVKTYEQIIALPRNRYSAEAYLVLGINSRQKEDFQQAIIYFSELEKIAENPDQTQQAVINLMRLHTKLNHAENADIYARKTLELPKPGDEAKNEARIIIGRNYLNAGKDDLALDEFNKLKRLNSEAGAEARYSIAQIFHNKGDYKKCEKAIFDLIEEIASYDYWLTRSFILLADNYLKLGNVFQAERTLQSIIDNHEGKELRDLAIRKLDMLRAQQQDLNKENEPAQINEIQFNNAKRDDGLFDNREQEGGNNE